jgi:hypothetical protein
MKGKVCMVTGETAAIGQRIINRAKFDTPASGITDG